MKTKYSVWNAATSVLYFTVNTALGFIGRRVLVLQLGIEYQGIIGLFNSILTVLGIAELGIGTAIIYHLYKPVKKGDIEQTKAILAFYKKAYRYIILAIALLGSLLAIRIDVFVGENSLSLNFRLVYFLMLANVLASYTIAYKRSILYANQRNYIVSTANTVASFITNTAQIFLLYQTKNIYLYLLIKPICTIAENIVINRLIAKEYPYLSTGTAQKLDTALVKDITLKVKGLLFHKIGGFVVLGTDNILISKFIGIAATGIYSNYQLIVTAVNGICGQILEATTASVGHLLVSADKEKTHKVFDELQMLNLAISNFTTVSILCISNAFVSVFFGDENVLGFSVLAVVCLNFMLTSLRRVYGVFKTAGGIQYEDRFVPVVEAVVNLGASLLFIHYWGFAGVFMGTVVSNLCVFCYTFPVWIYKNLLGRPIKVYYFELIKSIFFILANCLVCLKVLSWIFIQNAILSLAVKLCVCLLLPNICFILCYHKQPGYRGLCKRLKLFVAARRH